MTKPAAFFDADETLIKGSTSFYLARELYRRGFFGWRDIGFAAWHALLYVAFGENRDRIRRVSDRATQVMAGHSLAEIESIGDEMYETMIGSRVVAGTKQILDQHLANGHEVWLISATPSQMARLIARRMGATGGVGTQIAVTDGIIQPRLDGPMMHGREKANTVRALAAERDLDLNASFAYSDSLNDLPLLHTVGHPVAVNPDPRLRIYAHKQGWQVRDFRVQHTASLQRAAKRSAQIAGTVWFLQRGLRLLWQVFTKKRG